MNPALRTGLCRLLGVEFPIVQTGMGWVAGPRLVSATSAAGGLGILAAATMTLDQLRDAIAEVRSRTDRPFGVNIRTDQVDVGERVELLVTTRVPVVSYAQAPSSELVARVKEAGIVNIATVGARRHAEKVAAWGVDAVIAQGGEGGGHTGTVPTSLLLPAVVDAVAIPVIAAGGFFDGRGLVAALSYGAAGVAMGTRFLLTQESTVPENVKRAYLDTAVTGTVVSSRVDGVPQRMIATDVVRALERSGRLSALPRAARNAVAFRRLSGASLRELLREGLAMRRSQDLSWSQMVMAANAPMMTKAALVDGRLDVGILPAGQVTGVIEELPTVADLIDRIVSEADETLARLCQGASDSQSDTLEP